MRRRIKFSSWEDQFPNWNKYAFYFHTFASFIYLSIFVRLLRHFHTFIWFIYLFAFFSVYCRLSRPSRTMYSRSILHKHDWREKLIAGVYSAIRRIRVHRSERLETNEPELITKRTVIPSLRVPKPALRPQHVPLNDLAAIWSLLRLLPMAPFHPLPYRLVVHPDARISSLWNARYSRSYDRAQTQRYCVSPSHLSLSLSIRASIFHFSFRARLLSLTTRTERNRDDRCNYIS